jgi:predicted metalloprotease
MRWKRGHKSADVIDRRGRRARKAGVIGGGGALLVILASLIFGKDVGRLLQSLGLGGGTQSRTATSSDRGDTGGPKPDQELFEFVSFVLDDVQDTWEPIFEQRGDRYRRAKLVVFTDEVKSACGFQSAATGPFYCPADHQAYIDLGFYKALSKRLGAPGDFAQAYVIAHEIAHHVQNLLGISARMRKQQRERPADKNELSVRLELQADCLAGVWAHNTGKRDLLEKGDIEEALTAAAAIGDDTLQRKSTGRIRPESWTHGSAAQRVTWFKKGLDGGTVEGCDTFAVASP